MKFHKIAAPLILILLLAALPLSAGELELGMSLTPIKQDKGDDPNAAENTAKDTILPGFHLGYRFAWIGFMALDSYVMPPEYITNMTATYDPDTDTFSSGPYRPGFLNTWNIGAKLVLGPLTGYSTIGLNTIYVYKESEYLDKDFNKNFGANWKIGAGLRTKNIGVNLDLMALFPSADTMFQELGLLFDGTDEEKAAAKERIQFIPSLVFVLYL